MSDGDVVHEWVDNVGYDVRAVHDGGIGLLVQMRGDVDGDWSEMPYFDRRDAEQLLVAFDKLEGKV